MDADFVPFVIKALQQVRVLNDLATNYEKSCLDVIFLQVIIELGAERRWTIIIRLRLQNFRALVPPLPLHLCKNDIRAPSPLLDRKQYRLA